MNKLSHRAYQRLKQILEEPIYRGCPSSLRGLRVTYEGYILFLSEATGEPDPLGFTHLTQEEADKEYLALDRRMQNDPVLRNLRRRIGGLPHILRLVFSLEQTP